MAGPSLLQALLETVHRELLPPPQQQQHHHHHQHIHQHLHRRQTVPDVTEVIQTISVIQQVTVDPAGSTIAILTFTASGPPPTPTDLPALTASPIPAPGTVIPTAEPPVTSQAPTSDAPSSAPSSDASAAPTASPTSLPSSSTNSDSLPPTTNALTPAPSTTSSLFPSLPGSNSTTSLSGSYTSNSTTSSLLAGAETETSSSTASDLSATEVYTSTADDASFTGSLGPTATGAGGSTGSFGVGTGSSPTSTPAAGGISTTDNTTAPSTGTVVGSVFGGLAGVAVILFVLMFILRWKKRRGALLPLGSGSDSRTGQASSSGSGGVSHSGPMTQRSIPFAIPSSLAGLTGYKRASQPETVSSAAGSERGFYRVSGRKLPSVLQSGGDGYGDDFSHGQNTLSGSSFYSDSRGFYGGAGSPTSPLAPSFTHGDSGIPVVRASPARTPVTSQGPFSTPLSPPPSALPRRPDGLGRSRYSQDGSKGSRFTEEV